MRRPICQELSFHVACKKKVASECLSVKSNSELKAVQFFAGAYVVKVPETERQRRRSLVDVNVGQIRFFDIINTNRSVVNILVPLVRIS